MDIEYLLTATRSARKSLDLDAPVGIEDIMGLHAALGPNQHSWRWLVVTDPGVRWPRALEWALSALCAAHSF
jgi:hypothetical protein